MYVLSHCYMSIIQVADHIWYGWITSQSIASPPTIPQTCSTGVTPVFGTQSLNHVTHQWCSGPRIITKVLIYYPTVLLVVYEACTTYDRVGSPHVPQYHLELHPRHAQMLPRILEQKARTIYLISGWVGKWWLDILSHCFVSVILDMDHIQYMCMTTHTPASPPTTPQTCSAVTLVFRTKTLNHVPPSVV